MKITIHVAPIGKPRMNKAHWKPAAMRYWAFKDGILIDLPENQLVALAKAEEFELLEFYLPIPKSWSYKKKIQHNGRPHKQKPDIDNLLKALFDAVMIEDKQVWRIAECGKWWSNDPRIEVEVK